MVLSFVALVVGTDDKMTIWEKIPFSIHVCLAISIEVILVFCGVFIFDAVFDLNELSIPPAIVLGVLVATTMILFFLWTVVNYTISISFKNMSATPLNISADELIERFVRGDSSRNTEGSGLGLSIASSLTELMGGKLDIAIDGDLFKAILTFYTAK